MIDKHCEETIDLTSLHLFKIEVPSTELYFRVNQMILTFLVDPRLCAKLPGFVEESKT